MQNDINNRLTRLNMNMLDISEAVDQHTKAIITIYQAIQAIAKDRDIKLPEPLCDMTIEKNLINRNNDVIDSKAVGGDIRVIDFDQDFKDLAEEENEEY